MAPPPPSSSMANGSELGRTRAAAIVAAAAAAGVAAGVAAGAAAGEANIIDKHSEAAGVAAGEVASAGRSDIIRTPLVNLPPFCIIALLTLTLLSTPCSMSCQRTRRTKPNDNGASSAVTVPNTLTWVEWHEKVPSPTPYSGTPTTVISTVISSVRLPKASVPSSRSRATDLLRHKGRGDGKTTRACLVHSSCRPSRCSCLLK